MLDSGDDFYVIADDDDDLPPEYVPWYKNWLPGVIIGAGLVGLFFLVYGFLHG